MRQIIYLLLISLHLFSLSAYAQTDTEKGNIKIAKDNFTMEVYKDALDEYLLLITNDSDNVTYNYRIGVCYLYTDIDKSKAVYFLEKAILDPKVDVEAWYDLGSAYLLNYRFDEAISSFEKYLELTNGKENFEISVERMMQMCEEAKKQVENPVNVSLECLGPEINTEYADYKPYVPADESFIVFTSKRKGNTGNLLDFDGYNTSDVYISYMKYDKWSKAKGIGSTINSELAEETAGLSPDGTKLFVYVDNYTAMGQTMLSERRGRAYQKPVFLGDNFSNIKLVTSAIISPNRKMLIFACNLNETAGGMDLYMSHKLPTGNWGPPENMGDVINTVYNEDYPYFSPNGRTLYFSSQGHNSMGGYDLFKTNYDVNSESWSEPVNLGYPVNTPGNDMTISFSASGRHGYISSLRKNGYGDLDIYKVIFKDVDPAYMVISGELLNKDSINIFKTSMARIETLKTDHQSSVSNNLRDSIKRNDRKEIKQFIESEHNVNIAVINKTTNKPYGKFLPNKTNGKFLIILPPGEYELEVKVDGYEKYTETIKVFDKSSNSEVIDDIVLTSIIEEGNSKKEKNKF